MVAPLQRSNHLALMGDVLLPAMEKAFGVSKKLFQGGAVHGGQGSSQIDARRFFCTSFNMKAIARRADAACWLLTEYPEGDRPGAAFRSYRYDPPVMIILSSSGTTLSGG